MKASRSTKLISRKASWKERVQALKQGCRVFFLGEIQTQLHSPAGKEEWPDVSIEDAKSAADHIQKTISRMAPVFAKRSRERFDHQ